MLMDKNNIEMDGYDKTYNHIKKDLLKKADQNIFTNVEELYEQNQKLILRI
jgi:hypothetical protein